MGVLVAMGRFEELLSAHDACEAASNAAWEVGVDAVERPLSDGGPGLLEALGGANRVSTVTGPLGTPTSVGWRLDHRTAVIEVAAVNGVELIGGIEFNDPVAASTRGVGELIDAALREHARTIVVGMGGSAATDGGLGAIEALGSINRLATVELLVGFDSPIEFAAAAAEFADRKGATPRQTALLTNRLQSLAARYRDDYGVDVTGVEGAGASGGLAGGLFAVGGRLIAGFDAVADIVDLDEAVAAADHVITGERYLDDESVDHGVIGGVARLARAHGRPLTVITVECDDEAVRRLGEGAGVEVVVLAENRLGEPRHAITAAVRASLASR